MFFKNKKVTYIDRSGQHFGDLQLLKKFADNNVPSGNDGSADRAMFPSKKLLQNAWRGQLSIPDRLTVIDALSF